MRRTRALAGITVALVGAIGLGQPSLAAKPSFNPAAPLLSLSDMPTGWSIDHAANSSSSSTPACLKHAQASKKAATAEADFVDGSNFPALKEDLDYYPSAAIARTALTAWTQRLNGCGVLQVTSDGTTLKGQIGAMSFTRIGDQSSAFQMTLSAPVGELQITATADLVAIRYGKVDILLTYEDLDTPDVTQLRSFAKAALGKVQRMHGTTTAWLR